MTSINRKMIVVILGGGQGNRLYPLTQKRSKPAVPIAGKYRLIDIPVSNCLHSGINRIFVLTQFNSASLNQHIARTYNFDSFTDGFVDVLAAEQTMGSSEWFQGTADAVRKIYPHIVNQDWDQLLILSGDHLYRMDYVKFLEYHLLKQWDISVCVVGIKEKGASEFGLLKVDDSGRISEFAEKPGIEEQQRFKMDMTQFGLSPDEAKKKPFLASMGIYLFNRPVMEQVLFENRGLNDFGKQIIPENLMQKRLGAYLFSGYWEDIGSITSFFEANLSLCKYDPPFKLFHPTRPIYTRQRYLSGSRMVDTIITDCIVNDGCFIDRATLKNSVIGLRSIINEGSVIEGSLLMGADYYQEDSIAFDRRIGIGKGVRIKGAIIDKNAHIGNNVVIINEKGQDTYDDPEGRYYIRDGIVIVVKDSTIPDGMVI